MRGSPLLIMFDSARSMHEGNAVCSALYLSSKYTLSKKKRRVLTLKYRTNFFSNYDFKKTFYFSSKDIVEKLINAYSVSLLRN